jgi:hypothetical protein
VYTLWALAVTSGDIEYGTLNVGEDTGSINVASEVQNSGNSNIDIEVDGTDLTNGASSIPVGNQRFASSTFTYSSCTICESLSGVATELNVNINKPTSTSTPETTDIYWGIYVPTGVAGLQHYGQNTFYAIGS